MDRAEIDLILESKPRKFHRNNLVKALVKTTLLSAPGPSSMER